MPIMVEDCKTQTVGDSRRTFLLTGRTCPGLTVSIKFDQIVSAHVIHTIVVSSHTAPSNNKCGSEAQKK